MKKLFQIIVLVFLLGGISVNSFSQEKEEKDVDLQFKNTLYKKYRREVLSYNRKNFDDLMFEFFGHQGDENQVLTKEEYYTYTIKIAIYSEKLGLLYKDKKEEAKRTKQEWFDRKYSDYLSSKN